ncbi:MAG: hypothetical protein ABIH83_00360 [Candidatus Micrarchaeota archaeon]
MIIMTFKQVANKVWRAAKYPVTAAVGIAATLFFLKQCDSAREYAGLKEKTKTDTLEIINSYEKSRITDSLDLVELDYNAVKNAKPTGIKLPVISEYNGRYVKGEKKIYRVVGGVSSEIDANTALDELRDKNAKQRHQIKALKNKIAGLKEQNKESEYQIVSLQSQIKALKNKIAGLKEQNKESEYQIAGLQHQIKALRKEIAELKGQKKKLKRENAELQKNIRELIQMLAKKEEGDMSGPPSYK